jgi:hypothetical protein
MDDTLRHLELASRRWRLCSANQALDRNLVHFRPREQSDGYAAAADAAAHQQMASVPLRPKAKVSRAIAAAERTAGKDERSPPGKGDLTTVRMAAEGDIESAVT